MTTASTSTAQTTMVNPPPLADAVQTLLTTAPCQMVRLEKFANVTLTSPALAAYGDYPVLLDRTINYKSNPVNKKKHLILSIEARNPVTNAIVDVCNGLTCVADEMDNCLKCQHDRETIKKKYDHNKIFRQKLIHASQVYVATPIIVGNNNISFKMRINCATSHQGVEFFIFLIELVDQDGVARFRGAFTANVRHSAKGALPGDCGIITLQAV